MTFCFWFGCGGGCGGGGVGGVGGGVGGVGVVLVWVFRYALAVLFMYWKVFDAVSMDI